MIPNPLLKFKKPDIISYLGFARNKGSIIEIPRDTTSHEYGVLVNRLARTFRCDEAEVTLVDLHNCEVTSSGVFFSWGLAGPSGAWYNLLHIPHSAAEGYSMPSPEFNYILVNDTQVKNGKREIRVNQDVVSLRVNKIKKLLLCK